MSAEGLAARRAAYDAVRRVHVDGAWSAPAVSRAIDRLPERERAFAANLAFQTLRWEGTLDWALAQVVQRPGRVEDRVRDVLRLGVWQIGWGSTPSRAAVDTSVQLVREVVGDRASGFVNGVLRTLVRGWDELPWPSDDTDEGVGLRLGYPAWIVAEARRRFGDDAGAVLAAGNEPPGLTLRAADPEALVAELRSGGLDPVRGEWAGEAVRVAGADPSRIPAVAEGRAVVQDEASMLVAEAVLAVVPSGGRVLDVCSGPGGKATHLAARGARVLATERHPSRAQLVADLARRTGVGVEVVVADGTRPPWRTESFDAVLLDVPCTGLGVVRRRPELRWKRSADDVGRLARIQRDLLAASLPLVRPGGMLVYSACTWTAAETTSVVASFVERGEAEPASLPTGFPGRLPPREGGAQLRPDLHGTDGMYVSCLKRASAMPMTGGNEH